jgi:hypothetical protein
VPESTNSWAHSSRILLLSSRGIATERGFPQGGVPNKQHSNTCKMSQKILN